MHLFIATSFYNGESLYTSPNKKCSNKREMNEIQGASIIVIEMQTHMYIFLHDSSHTQAYTHYFHICIFYCSPVFSVCACRSYENSYTCDFGLLPADGEKKNTPHIHKFPPHSKDVQQTRQAVFLLGWCVNNTSVALMCGRCLCCSDKQEPTRRYTEKHAQ